MARRRAVHYCPSDCSRSARAAYVRAAEGFDFPPPVHNSDSGGYWRQGDCERNHCSALQGCNREMLWRDRKSVVLGKSRSVCVVIGGVHILQTTNQSYISVYITSNL